MDLGFFVVMGVIGGLLGATFNCLNKRLAKYRMRNVHPKPKLVRYLCSRPCPPSLPWLPGVVWTGPPVLRKAIMRTDPPSHASFGLVSKTENVDGAVDLLYL